MLRDIAYSMIFGLPLVAWLGLLTFSLFLLALAVMVINNYTKYRIPIRWHSRLALTALLIALVHGILGLSIYLNF